MAPIKRKSMLFLAAVLTAVEFAGAQSPDGPVVPKPDQPVQQEPARLQGKLKVRVTLVNTPVTVRNAKGAMIHDLEVTNFRITDNGVAQEISHFGLGGDPVSVVFLMETSSRIEPMLPQIRKTGILFTQTVMASNGEAAVVGFNDAVDKLQEFTTNGDLIENTVSRLETGTSGSRLFDAMALGVEMLSGRPQPTEENPGRRRVMFIVAEALDLGSQTKLGAVLRQAQLANVTIYSVGLSTTRSELFSKQHDSPPQMTPPGINPLPPMPGTVQTPTTEANRNGDIDLLRLAAWAVQHIETSVKDHPLEIATAATGGMHLATFKDRTIENAVDEIGGELHSQYNISYDPQGADTTGYHQIKVTLVNAKEKNLKVRTRPGYYVSPPEG